MKYLKEGNQQKSKINQKIAKIEKKADKIIQNPILNAAEDVCDWIKDSFIYDDAVIGVMVTLFSLAITVVGIAFGISLLSYPIIAGVFFAFGALPFGTAGVSALINLFANLKYNRLIKKMEKLEYQKKLIEKGVVDDIDNVIVVEDKNFKKEQKERLLIKALTHKVEILEKSKESIYEEENSLSI